MRHLVPGILLLSILAIRALAAEAPPPNVIVILADDLGYGDLGCYGSRSVATPRLDRMAAEGVRFSDFYSAAPFCSPSRAALLTGRLPARCGVPYVLFPAEHTGLPPQEITIAELLKGQGYATACVGKWHLGWDKPFRPARQGFDEFYGLPYSNDSTEWEVGQPFKQVLGLEPLPLLDGERIVEAPADQAMLTKRYTGRAVRFIRANRERPFFLYLAHTMPHTPLAASAAFKGKSRSGLYGDAVEELDWSVGVILDTLKELGIDGRTLVLFTSDNGAPVRPAPAGKAAKAPKAARGKKTFIPHSKGEGPVSLRDRIPHSNGPLRAGKGQTFEGGVRVPLIAWWPGRIGGGRTVADPSSMLDLFPTAARLAGAALPADQVYDGCDLGGLLTGAGERPALISDAVAEPNPPRLSQAAERAIYHYFGYQLQAVRVGRWKLFPVVDRYPDSRGLSLWFAHQPELFERQHRLWTKTELYDLSADPGETRDVAAEHPEVVARLGILAGEFDAKLQKDKRPVMFVPGPTPPAPGQPRRPDDDLSAWKTPARPY